MVVAGAQQLRGRDRGGHIRDNTGCLRLGVDQGDAAILVDAGGIAEIGR
jgi:hypothetical protein